MGRFQDRIQWRERDFRDMMRIWTSGGFANPRAANEAGQVPRADALDDLTPPNPGTAVTWIGHATTLVQVGGKSFLTDPVWSTKLPGFIPRLTPPGVAWERLPPIDGVVVSHDHYDHLDAATLKRLPRTTPVFAPLGVDHWFRRRGFTRVTGLDWWQEARLEGVTLTCVPVQHWCQRGLLDRNRRLWCGWVLAPKEGASVFFAGDTGYFEGLREIGQKLTPDVAVLPIGAYEPRWFMEPMHMHPEEAVQATKDLAAQVMVPMHWGTFCLSREPLLEPIERTRRAWQDTHFRGENLWDLALGERRTFTT